MKTKNLFWIIVVLTIVTVGCGAKQTNYTSASQPVSQPVVATKLIPVSAWGDSLTEQNMTAKRSWPTQFSLLLNDEREVYNGGKSGDTSCKAADRFLAQPERWGDITVIWLGRNDVVRDSSGAVISPQQWDAAQVVRCVHEITDKLIEPKRFVVLSIINGDFIGEFSNYPGHEEYSSIMAVNAALEVEYPNNYLDIRKELVNAYDPNVARDVLDYQGDSTPSTLHYDWLHLNDGGEAVVASGVKQWIETNHSEWMKVRIPQ